MPNQHAEDVKAKVRKTGISLAELARKNDLSDSATRKALYRPVPSGNRVIAKHLETTVNELWPEWFDAAGNRITSSQETSTAARARDSQKRAAP